MREVRKLRHWKQQWDKNATFIWRRPKTYAGELYMPGDPIPDELTKHPTKLRRFWESKIIELAEFEDPNVATGQVVSKADDLPEGVTIEKGKGSWFIVTTTDESGEQAQVQVNGQKKLDALLVELNAQMQSDQGENGSQDNSDTKETEDNKTSTARTDDDSWLDGETTNETVPEPAEVRG